MKNKILAVLLIFTMIISFSSCEQKQEDPKGSSESSETKKSGEAKKSDDKAGNTLTVWTWDPNFNVYAIEKAAEIYAKDHEGFKVEVEEVYYEDIETKITTAVSAGDLSTLPDIFLMQDNSFQKYITNYPNVFTDLTNSGIDFNGFAPAKVKYSTVDGKNYAIPFDNGAVISAFREDYLQKAGFTIEDFTDITWDKYIEMGKKVKEAAGVPMMTGIAGEPDLIMIMLQSAGASLFNEDGTVNIADNKALKEAIKVYTKMVEDGVLAEVNSWDQYVGSLNNGTCANTINGCWIMASIKAKEEQSGKWGITNMPKLNGLEGATNYSNNGGSSWAISSNCKDKDLAFDFMNATFGSSTDLYEDVIVKGAISTLKKMEQSDVYTKKEEFFGNKPVYSKIVSFASSIPENNTGAFYYDARNAVGVALSNISQKGADIDAELKAAQETVEFNMGE